jgi:hypothetical protein
MSRERPDIEGIRRKNIIDMALGFTAMTRIFSAKSKAKIEAQLEVLFTSLTEINTRAEYEARHRSFCEWFAQEIRTAEKRLKNGKLQPSEPSSYGQGAKVLDIAIKVYVYYCAQPTAQVAQRIVPLLNGAVDVPILKVLKKSEYATDTIRATTIKEIDEAAYLTLQAVVLAESHIHEVYPVQYDDIMWAALKRGKLAAATQVES